MINEPTNPTGVTNQTVTPTGVVNSGLSSNNTTVTNLLDDIIVDFYPFSYSTIVVGISTPGSYAVGQSFIAKQSILQSATFFLRKVGLPEGTFRAYLYAHSGDFGESSVPTGDPLATSITEIKIEDLSTKTTPYVFEFADGFKMKDGEMYVIVVGGEHTVAGSNITIRISVDNATLKHPGNRSFSFGGDWSASNTDLIFYVNGLRYTAPENEPTVLTSLTNI